MEIYKSLWLRKTDQRARQGKLPDSRRILPKLYDQVLRLRDAVEETDLYSKLSTEKWFMLCAAMDAIEDTQQAIEDYVTARTNQKRRTGERYLRAYGVLQALVVQKDAARDLCNALSVEALWNPSPVEKIRELRIQSIGHPTLTRKSRSRSQSSHFIIQISLGDRGFELISFDSKGNRTTQVVSIPGFGFGAREAR